MVIQSFWKVLRLRGIEIRRSEPRGRRPSSCHIRKGGGGEEKGKGEGRGRGMGWKGERGRGRRERKGGRSGLEGRGA